MRQVCSFFQAAFKGNADRVMGPENPRTFQEMVTFFNSMDWAGLESSFSKGDAKRKALKRTHSDSLSKVSKKESCAGLLTQAFGAACLVVKHVRKIAGS